MLELVSRRQTDRGRKCTVRIHILRGDKKVKYITDYQCREILLLVCCPFCICFVGRGAVCELGNGSQLELHFLNCPLLSIFIQRFLTITMKWSKPKNRSFNLICCSLRWSVTRTISKSLFFLTRTSPFFIIFYEFLRMKMIFQFSTLSTSIGIGLRKVFFPLNFPFGWVNKFHLGMRFLIRLFLVQWLPIGAIMKAGPSFHPIPSNFTPVKSEPNVPFFSPPSYSISNLPEPPRPST